MKAFSDFKDGLNQIGNLWNVLEPWAEIQSKLLGTSNDAMTPDIIEELLEYNFSVHGSNKFALEQQTVFSLSLYLQKLQGKIRGFLYYYQSNLSEFLLLFLGDGHNAAGNGHDLMNEYVYQGPLTLPLFLQVLTGASRIPPLGFSKRVSVTWFDKEEGVVRFPKISTCGLQIELPRGCPDDEEFATYMDIAIPSSINCFGHV